MIVQCYVFYIGMKDWIRIEIGCMYVIIIDDWYGLEFEINFIEQRTFERLILEFVNEVEIVQQYYIV